MKIYDYDTKQDSQTVLKEKEIFNRLIDKMHDGILELSEKINHDDLMDHVLRKF